MSNYPTFYAYLQKKILRFQKNRLVFRRNTRSAFGHTPSNLEACWEFVANSTQLATYLTF